MNKIKSGTFAEACYEQNSLQELEEALKVGPDTTDLDEWGISPQEWEEQIKEAISAKIADL